MSRSFLTTAPAFDTYPGLLVQVAVAWGGDITDLDGSGWTWDDITDDVILGGEGGKSEGRGISITLGRPDFSQETQTAEMTFQLDNRTGEYSEGGQSSHWPYVRRGTPVRVRVSDDAGSTWSVRFQGAANGFTPQWDPDTSRWATVTLSASGPLRRLNQGTLPGFSAMRVGTLADSTVKAYWPMEEEQQSRILVAAVGAPSAIGDFRTIVFDGTEHTVPGAPGDFASYTSVPSSAPMLTMKDGGAAVFSMTTTTSTSSTTSVILGGIVGVKPVDNPMVGYGANTGSLFSVFTPNGASIKKWEVAYLGGYDFVNSVWTNQPGNILAVRGYAVYTDGVADAVFESTFRADNLFPNTDYEVGLTLTQSGATTTWRVWLNPCVTTTGVDRFSFSETRGSNSNGAQVNGGYIGAFSDMEGLGAGHLVVRAPSMALWADEAWMRGHPGEDPTDRMGRLCTQNGIHLTVLDYTMPGWVTATDSMGPQYYDTITNQLREIERTGQGVLCDGLGPGLTYVTRGYREKQANGPATLVLDAAQAHLMEPFTPIDDDQLTINNCDVNRRDATAVSYIDRSGPMGVDAIGDFSTSYTLNPEGDSGLVGYAEWVVGIGSRTGYRYPSVSFALETNPDLIGGWLDVTPQSRLDIENITSIRRQHPDYTIRLLVEGWHEEIDAFTWRVTANTSPADPWNVIRLAAATGSTGDGVGRLQTVDSQLNANYTSGTSISVKTNSGNIWVTTAVDADSFPFDIDVGGCKATVTAITGASSPQTFTLSAALPRAMTGSTTIGAGTPVKVWRPPVFAI